MKVIYNGTEIDADGPVADAYCYDYIIARAYERNPEIAVGFSSSKEILEKWLATSSKEMRKDIEHFTDEAFVHTFVESQWLAGRLLHKTPNNGPTNVFKTYALLYRKTALQLAISILLNPCNRHKDIADENERFLKEAREGLKAICKDVECNDSSYETLRKVTPFSKEEDGINERCNLILSMGWSSYTQSWARGYIKVADDLKIWTLHPRGNRGMMLSVASRGPSTNYHHEHYFQFGRSDILDLVTYAQCGNGYSVERFWDSIKARNALRVLDLLRSK